MEVTKEGHVWSEEALLSKATLYVEQMKTHTANDWLFAFWSSLALEFLLRGALAHVSPVLLANKDDWRHLAYAIGQRPTSKRYTPSTISTREVIQRLRALLPDFSEEIASFAGEHVARRNAELHSGELAFERLSSSTWLPQFYRACDVILSSMERELSDLVSNAAQAKQMIASLRDAAAEAVKAEIAAHARVWNTKDETEKHEAVAQAKATATRHKGHRVLCPACSCPALLHGEGTGRVANRFPRRRHGG